jgi:uncharacterized protein (DUF2062 family)
MRIAWSHLQRISIKLAGLNASPRRVATGFGIGVAVACTPFIGLHLVLAILAAACARVSIAAAVLGSFAANPWTYAPLLAGSYALGALLAGDGVSTAGPVVQLTELGQALWAGDWREVTAAWPILAQLLAGSLVMGAALGPAAALLAWWLLRRHSLEIPKS